MPTRLFLISFLALSSLLLSTSTLFSGFHVWELEMKKVEIEWFENGYVNLGTEKKVSPQVVDKFVSFWEQSPGYKCHITVSQHWLEKCVDQAITEYEDKRNLRFSKSQRAIVEKAFKDYWKEKRNPPSYSPHREENKGTYGISVGIETKDGELLTFTSQNPAPIFVPWKIECDGGTKYSHDEKITVAAIKCLGGVKEIAWPGKACRMSIMIDIAEKEHHYDLVEAYFEDELKKRVKSLDKGLVIESLKIYRQTPAIPYQPYMYATLRCSQLPKNFRFRMACRSPEAIKNSVSCLKVDLSRIMKNELLKKLVGDHPNHIFHVDYANERAQSKPTDFIVSGPKPLDTRSDWRLLDSGRLFLRNHYGQRLLSWKADELGGPWLHDGFKGTVIPWSKFGYFAQ